jgi:hypothetical protein
MSKGEMIMPAEYHYIDATDNPDELSRTAKEVVRSKRAQLVKIGEDEIVQLSPVEIDAVPAATTSKGIRSILNLLGIADDAMPEDAATDVSANKHKYLGDAYYSEFTPSDKK